MKRLGYRPDIDGLRAVAVLSVLLHHLNASLFPGGFVGVDIFFVISGYLITSQVLGEIKDGTFSLKNFYRRRINRIVPALVGMIAAALVIGVFVLSPADLVRLARSAAFAMLGLSNIFFWREYGNYFSANASEAPLLHTWSLGVEEQFYVVWPLLVLLLARLRPQRYVGVLLAFLVVAAIATSELAVWTLLSASYYLLPSRFFELLMGGLLAHVAARKQPGSSMASGACAVAGFTLIGASIFVLSKSSPFPGVHAFWPCLGASLLIWAGRTKHAISGILGNRPMVFIGLISYSLYLWHWPLIAYLNYTNVAINLPNGLAVAAAAVLLAFLSWKFIEAPMRRNGAHQGFSRILARRAALPAVAIASVAMATSYAAGFPARFDSAVASFERVLDSRPEILRARCHVPTARYATPPDAECRLGVAKSNPDGLLVGDSYANHFTGMIDVMAQAAGISFLDYTMDGCPPLLGYVNGKTPAHAERCRKRNEAVYTMISEGHFSRVILAASWLGSPAVGESLAASIEAILKAGATPTIIMNNQTIERAASCPVRRLMYALPEECEGPRSEPPTYFRQIRERFPMLRIIDPNQVICAGQICSPVVGGIPLYRDDGHLNDAGSRLIGRQLLVAGAAL